MSVARYQRGQLPRRCLPADIAKRRIFQGFEYDDDVPQPA